MFHRIENHPAPAVTIQTLPARHQQSCLYTLAAIIGGIAWCILSCLWNLVTCWVYRPHDPSNSTTIIVDRTNHSGGWTAPIGDFFQGIGSSHLALLNARSIHQTLPPSGPIVQQQNRPITNQGGQVIPGFRRI